MNGKQRFALIPKPPGAIQKAGPGAKRIFSGMVVEMLALARKREAHPAVPKFIFELAEDTVRLRLLARSERDQSVWRWTGQDWQRDRPGASTSDTLQILDDPRLEAAVQWLRWLDLFSPEQGVWVGDANENFLSNFALGLSDRPEQAEFDANPAFHRLFFSPPQLRPKLILKCGGTDWLTVSIDWEAGGIKLTQADLHRLETADRRIEGRKLTPADLQRLQAATRRIVRLPDAGLVTLDSKTIKEAREVLAHLGLGKLSTASRRVSIEQVAHLDENRFEHFADTLEMQALRKKLAALEGRKRDGS